MEQKQASVTLQRLNDFEFKVSFNDKGRELIMDEPEPLGGNQGPNASQVLSAAIGNCLSASLLFCLQKSRAEAKDLKTTVTTTIGRNDKGRFRVEKTEVTIELEVSEDDDKKLGRCTDLFEDFCIVTAAVREGIEVDVTIKMKGTDEVVYDSSDHK